MDLSEFTRLAMRLTTDSQLRDALRTGRPDALVRAGFEVDADALAALRRVDWELTAEGLLARGPQRPWDWVVNDGDIDDEYVVKVEFQVTTATAMSTTAFPTQGTFGTAIYDWAIDTGIALKNLFGPNVILPGQSN